MGDRGKDIPSGLLAYVPDVTYKKLTRVPPEKWSKPSFQPQPDGSGKDRFGNRIHYSPDFAYLDRNNNVVRAGLLLSPDGQELVRGMPGCLTQLNHAINQLSEVKQPKVEFKYGILSDAFKSGDQSKIYIWETHKGVRYVIKVPLANSVDILPALRVDQPYIDEMLQTQEIQTALKPLLDAKNVKLSTFLFASSSVSCTKFEEGEHPDDWNDDQHERFSSVINGVRSYISKRRHSDDSLFYNVIVDAGDGEKLSHPSDNVIIDASGSIVWIDPFVT